MSSFKSILSDLKGNSNVVKNLSSIVKNKSINSNTFVDNDKIILNKELPFPYSNIKNFVSIVTLDLLIVENNETNLIELTEAIKSFSLYKIYNDFRFPVFNVVLTITQDIHERISNNLENVMFRLNIDLTEENSIDLAVDIQNFKPVLSDRLIKDLLLVSNDYDKSRITSKNESQIANKEEVHSVTVSIDLFFKEHLKMQKDVVSGIYENCNLSDLLITLLENTKSKMLVHPVDNTNLIKQVILPNKNIVQSIENLQEVYGLYNDGLRLFFDFDRGYCLSNNLKDKGITLDEQEEEYENVIIYLGKSVIDLYGCYFDSNSKTYYMMAQNTTQFKFSDASVKALHGENMLIQSKSQELKKLINSIQDMTGKFIENNKSLSPDIINKTNEFQKKINQLESSLDFNSLVLKKDNLPFASALKEANSAMGKLGSITSELSKTISNSSKNLMNNLNTKISSNINKAANNVISSQTKNKSNNILGSCNKLNLGGELNSIISKNTSKFIDDLNSKINSQLKSFQNEVQYSNQRMYSLANRTKMEADNFISNIKNNISGSVKSTNAIKNLLDEFNNKVKVYYKNLDNPCIETSKTAEISKEEMKFHIIMKNIDDRYLTINKKIIINFIDDNCQMYNGTYQIEAIITNYSKKSKNVFESLHSIHLCKLPKDYLANS